MTEDKKHELEEQLEKELKRRPRSPTLLNLQWLAEKMRKAAVVKDSLSKGSYEVDSDKLAESLLNKKD